jgi:hypothetical protein
MDEHTTISKHTILDQESPQSNVKIHVLRGIRTTKPSIEINNHLIWQASPPPPSYFRFSLWPHTRCLRHPLSCHYMHYPSPSIRHSQSSPIPNPTPTPSPQNPRIAPRTFETLTCQPRRSITLVMLCLISLATKSMDKKRVLKWSEIRWISFLWRLKKPYINQVQYYKIMCNKKYKHVQGECRRFHWPTHANGAPWDSRLMGHFLRNVPKLEPYSC